MSLDEQLRAALTQEADRRTAPRPDIDALISGGRARRRRRAAARMGAVAAATVLVGAATYGVAQVDSGDSGSGPGVANQPSPPSPSASSTTPPPYLDLNSEMPAPGTYRKAVGTDRFGATIEADLTFGRGWLSGAQPVISADDSSSAGVGVLEAQYLPGESACTPDGGAIDTFRKAATAPRTLGRQLAELPGSEVIRPLATTEAFGHEAVHLRLQIDAECPGSEIYLVAEADTGALGITYNAPWSVVVDFLVVDVDGTPIVVALWHDAHAPTELVDEATLVRDSITFVPR